MSTFEKDLRRDGFASCKGGLYTVTSDRPPCSRRGYGTWSVGTPARGIIATTKTRETAIQFAVRDAGEVEDPRHDRDGSAYSGDGLG